MSARARLWIPIESVARLAWAAGCSVVILLVSCAGVPTSPRERRLPPLLSVDKWQTWSNRGDRIAFQRGFASQYGPPGLYITSKWGGTPRLLLAGGWLWPSECRFSRDDEWLAAVNDNQLVLVEVATGRIRAPLYSRGGVSGPDWSPAGDTLIYLKLRASGDPADSIGLYFLDLPSGTTRPLRDSTGTVVYGRQPRWSPDGSLITFLDGTASTTRISAIAGDGSGRRVIWESSLIINALQWYQRPARAERKLLFRLEGQRPIATYCLNPDGSEMRLFERNLGPWDVLSPDGEEVCFNAYSPDTLDLLFIERTNDFSGASRRQLTSWRPPE